MAHVTLLRNNTATVFQTTVDGITRAQHTMSSSGATRASQLSGSTAFNSTTSLNSLSSAQTLTNGSVVATQNIINQRADASRSLYQICLALKQRLSLVPGFEGYLRELEQASQDPENDDGPVESLWHLLQTGRPLLTIYNLLRPENPILDVGKPEDSETKKSKIATVKFIQQCLKIDLNLPSHQCFIVADLMGTDTTGFVKVTTAINYVLDVAQDRGLLRQSLPYPEEDPSMQQGGRMSSRDYVVKELVDTERKYVQDLENLFDLKNTLEQKGVIPGDLVYKIFLNINNILDFQRRFLIRIETVNSTAEDAQRWGVPFVNFEEQFCETYPPFIANQRKAAQLATKFFESIKAADHPVACDSNTLGGFLLKPMQRLSKYPLLLQQLLKKAERQEVTDDLAAGLAAAETVMRHANDAINQDLLDEALEELRDRVDDWKNHRVEQFGKLLMHGVHAVITGKTDQERDYEIYLFDCILLCCKEATSNKKGDKKDKTKSAGPKSRTKGGKLQLKGRIFMSNVTDVVAISKTGSYTVQIWWKGDPGVENFMVRFNNEETMKKWAASLDRQRKANTPQAPASPEQTAPNFAWMKLASQGPSENPYAQLEEDDDEDTVTGFQHNASQNVAQPTITMPGTMPRNSSNTSLRQRSATGESLTLGRIPPARFPMPQPSPLSLQTQNGALQTVPSPGPRGGDSYFSPVAESPASSRTSTTSGMFPPSGLYNFPTAGMPLGWSSGEDHRYTAPAMPRAPSRDGPSPVNAYGIATSNGRNPRGPSLPVMPRDVASQMQQQRSRSYSTPDINGQPGGGRRPSVQQNVPAMPSIPSHLTHERYDSNISRSNSGSPANELPMRTNTQSPGTQRARQQTGGTMAQFPLHPVYRQGTPNNSLAPTLGPPPSGLPPLAPIEPSRPIPPGLSSGNPFASPPSPNLDLPFPTQLQVKVHFDNGNYITLIMALANTSWDSLRWRIDNKITRMSSATLASGDLKLRYRDEDGDLIAIESDEDVQMAIDQWRESLRDTYTVPGGVGEIELFCSGEMKG